MRLVVDKTLKLYIGGKFPRSESGRTVPAQSIEGGVVNVARASRKDLRDAIQIARKAQAGWAARTAYNRGQILYRLAEMLEGRRDRLYTDDGTATAAIDRVVHHAGWADKISAVLSTLNPVAATYVNYSKIRPLGLVVAAPATADGLVGMVEAVCVAAVMGNAVLVLVPPELAQTALALAEALHTADWPGGVVNILTGDVPELLGVASIHDDVDGLYLAGEHADHARSEIDTQAARVMRRVVRIAGASRPATPNTMQRLAEVQTVWMSAYEPRGGAAAY